MIFDRFYQVDGASFTIQLPIRQTAKVVNEVEAPTVIETDHLIAPAAIGKPEPAQSSDIRPQVLIIEDNPDVVHYLKSCLQGLYQLEVAFNGTVGIDDVMMPEKDGFEVCDILKNDEKTVISLLSS